MVENLRMSGVLTLLEEMSVLISMASHNKDVEARKGVAFKDDAKNQEVLREAVDSTKFIVKATTSLLKLMKSGHVEDAMDRLQSWAGNDNKRWNDLFIRSCALRDAVKIEFKEYLFYVYSKEKGQKLKAWEADWTAVHTAFPDVRVESYCATDCYALTHYTASVFHSMRIAEIGLRALANERRIKLPKNKTIEWGTWQEIIRALDNEIGVIGKTWKAGSRKDAALEFYSGARADLNGFKDEFRNLVMHVREQYDEFQAARALARVHDFMGRLAEKIDHKHQRIKWGRTS